ncbi:MAG TPA: GDSL-type esterase/lipase family protein [Opitutaceae bacterium]|nr:GDSL-type esterase/lipase family protein [Opitutaceae bacterium]
MSPDTVPRPPDRSLMRPWKWEGEVAGLVQRAPSAPIPLVCIGSSSFTLWRTLDADLGAVGALNHGFGGCEISDCMHFCPQLVLPFRPRRVLFCAGDNDLGNGKPAAQVTEDYCTFCQMIWRELPQARVLFVSIKPSPARWSLLPLQTQVNEHIRAWEKTEPRTGFIDIRPVMLDSAGRPRPELYAEDGLHLSPAGYAAWAEVLRPRLQIELAAG